MNEAYKFNEENEVEEIYHYGFSKIKIMGNYIGDNISKDESGRYVDNFGNIYTKDYREKTLVIDYLSREKLRTCIKIQNFKEGDYGLWLERVPPYYIENGNILCKITRKKDSPKNIKAEAENDYLALEERIIDDFLWIQAHDKLIFPSTQEDLSPEENENLDDKLEEEQKIIETREMEAEESEALTTAQAEVSSIELLDIDISPQKAGKGKKLFVTSGAKLKCNFGEKEGKLTATVAATVAIDGQVKATIMDSAPMANIAPFGKCKCMGYPLTAAATAANKGKLKPMPCMPGTGAPWTGGSGVVNVMGAPALLENSKLVCMFGGQIQITDPAQKLTKGK